MEVSPNCSRHHGLQTPLLSYPKAVAVGFVYRLQHPLDAFLVLERGDKRGGSKDWKS